MFSLTGVCLTIQGTLTTAIFSDIINSRNIDIFKVDSDSESSWQDVDSDKQKFSPSEGEGEAGGGEPSGLILPCAL